MRLEKVLGGVLMTLLLGMAPARRALTIDDVLDTVALDRVTPSPDGEWVAAVVPRPARAGETAGRNAYETDPSRSDVWLVSRRTGERRNLSNGAANAAGFWCATWSPDGRMLAMLSTSPEGVEPRGGDNVRLYVWDRAGGHLRRLSSAAVMTQGRYGSGLYPLDVRGGADGGSIAHTCRSDDENAGFAWLDDHRLVALMLPSGQVSALLDQYGRPFDEVVRTRAALRDGRTPTVTAVGSGEARVPRDEAQWRATLTIVDARSGITAPVADVPIYPFSGELTVSIAPDLRRISILAPVRKLPFTNGVAPPFNNGDWHVEKRLGVVDITSNAPVRWVALPSAARLPLEMLDWSPDSRHAAFRARSAVSDRTSTAFVLDAASVAVDGIGKGLVTTTSSLGQKAGRPIALWSDAKHLLLRARQKDGKRDDWWLATRERAPVNVTAALTASPATFRRRTDGVLTAAADGRLAKLDPKSASLIPIGNALRKDAAILFPEDPAQRTSTVLLTTNGIFDEIDATNGRLVAAARLAPSEIHGFNNRGLIWSEQTAAGLFLRDTRLESGAQRDLLTLDRHLDAVAWGERRIIDYSSTVGTPLKAAVILPPDYRPGRRYPVLTWVYGGYQVSGLDDFWLNRYAPGIYNLQLYAAHGYVVLVPSIPTARDGKEDVYASFPSGVMPAIDKLVALGIADPDRVAVMGQSFGGYTVYALVSQSDRFRAAIAVAGITDPAQAWGQFDPAARGYPGFEDEKSANWSIYENAYGDMPPYAASERWARGSALAHVDRVNTPLLMIHGELDLRDPLAQVEPFFFALSRQGKTARLLRYWGENHSLAASPANVRDVYGETLAWLDRYTAPNPAPH